MTEHEKDQELAEDDLEDVAGGIGFAIDPRAVNINNDELTNPFAVNINNDELTDPFAVNINNDYLK